MLRRIIALLAAGAAVHAAAAVVDVNLPYKELRLKDGLFFTNAAVRSYNSSAGTAILQVNQDLISVRAAMLPDDVAARLQSLAPAQTADERAQERKQEEADRKKSAEKSERRQRIAEEEAQAARAANRELNVKAAARAAEQADATLAAVAKFAEERAKAYFQYRDDPFSNIGAVIGSDIYLENPEPVPGWSGRYRVEGTASRQYLNNQGSGFGRGGKDFEMLIQTREHEHKKPEIVEIRIK